MTYCVGVLLDSGLVLASDSRTNAGVDHIGTFRKMTVFERPGDRVLVMLSSGNLSVTQSVVNLLEQWTNESRDNLWNAPSMYQATCLVGEALREVQKRDGPYLMPHNIDTTAGFILGGQIAGQKHQLFNIYAQGNFIEATQDTPFFQNGELGCVQTRWGHTNQQYNSLTRAEAMGIDGHFIIEQTVRSKNGFFLNFNGTAGLWRRACIEDAGGWQWDTLTEDLDLSYRAQMRGWRICHQCKT